MSKLTTANDVAARVEEIRIGKMLLLNYRNTKCAMSNYVGALNDAPDHNPMSAAGRKNAARALRRLILAAATAQGWLDDMEGGKL